MRHFRTLAFAAFVLLLPARGWGQSITSPYEYIETRHAVGVFGGYLETNTGSLDLGPTSAPILGVRYAINLTGPLYGDVDVGVAPSTRTVYARTSNVANAPLTAIAEIDAVLLLIEGNLRFQLTGARTWHRLAPYVVAFGGAATNLTPGSSREEVLTEDQVFRFGPAFAAGGGLGTEFFASERLSVRLDFRDHLWRLTRPIGLTGATEREHEWRHNFGLTLGTAIHF